MVCTKIVCYLFILSVIVTYHVADSYPSLQIISRQRRVSDQKLAELETLVGLSKLKGKIVTVPIAFGVVDPAKLGRRRRTIEALLNRPPKGDISSPEEDAASEG